jgi:hypothetical protein
MLLLSMIQAGLGSRSEICEGLLPVFVQEWGGVGVPRSLFLFFQVVLICWSTAGVSFAQSASTADIRGRVTDAQRSGIANATVTAINTASNISRSVRTTSTGNYDIPYLPPGAYDIKVEAQGFARAESKHLSIRLGDTRDVNWQLRAGAGAETSSMEGAPLVETATTDVSTLGTELDAGALPALPPPGSIPFAGLNGTLNSSLFGFAGEVVPTGAGANDFAQLALMAPGTKQDVSGIPEFAGRSEGGIVAPGAMNSRANLYNVDGANITDQLMSGPNGLGASLDEIQEFQVLSGNYNAEYGQAAGLILNAVTKSGSNAIHGEGHAYFRGRNLAASNPFYNLTLFLLAAPAGKPNFFGGPHCPTTDFSGTPKTLTNDEGCDRAPFHRQEGGFTLGGPFIKDRLFWFASYESSRQAVPVILTTSFTSTAPSFLQLQQPTNNLLYSGKIDYRINPKHELSVRYHAERSNQDNLVQPLLFSFPFIPATPDFLTTLSNHDNHFNVGLVSSLTPTMINQARFAFSRSIDLLADNSAAPMRLFIPLSGANLCCPEQEKNKRYQYIDNLTWSHGAHTFKTGLNISSYPWSTVYQPFQHGLYLLSTPTVPASFIFTAPGSGATGSKDNIYGFYFQDTWKVARNLTMNAGLRYDVEAGAFRGGPVAGPGGACFQRNGIIPACSSDYNNWQPRLGFTWQPWQKTLFKASFAEVTMPAFNNVALASLNSPGPLAGFRATSDPAVLAAFPNFPSAALLANVPPVPSFLLPSRAISNHLKNPEVRMFNLGIQHEFSRSFSAEIQYVGQFGFGLFGERDTNAPVVAPDPAHPGYFYFQLQKPVDPALPPSARPDNRFDAIRTIENSRTSHYNGLLLSATKRFSSHVQFVASYTWSHALTSSEGFFGPLDGGITEPADQRNVRSELGPALNDIRHAANFGVVLDSGRVTNMKLARLFTNDLGLAWVGQLQSGRPYPFSTGTVPFLLGVFPFTSIGFETPQRPDVLPDGTISTAGIASGQGSNALFGPGAVARCITAGFAAAQCNSIQNTFLAPANADPAGPTDPLTFESVDFKSLTGNMGKNAGRQSPYYRFDASLKKTLKVPHAERVSLELRADAFNLFNHSNWQGFNVNNITSFFSFGQLSTSAQAGRGFFDCTNCLRPNGTVVGTNGQALKITDIQKGKRDGNLLKPAFQSPLSTGFLGIFGGIGDPSSADIARTFQLSFHVRF